MFGPKTEIALQKRTETASGGTVSIAWSHVQFIEAVIRPFSEIEKQLYGREAVLTMKKCLIGYNEIADANRDYLDPESRMLIDGVEYGIESVEPVTGPGRHFRVILRKIE